MQTVHLTVQMRDPKNQRRVTQHDDVPIGQAGARAAEIAGRMASFLRKQQKKEEVQG